LNLAQKKKAKTIAIPVPNPVSIARAVASLASEALFGEEVARALPDAGRGGPLEPVRELMDFDRLRLAAAWDRHRSRLRLIVVADQYLELIASLGPRVEIDLPACLAACTARAQAIEALAVPADHEAPAPIDGFDFAYAADLPLDVPSDGGFHAVTLAQREGQMALEHVSVPRETSDVFRMAVMVNPLDAPLLPGPVDITVADEFRLTSQVRAAPAHGRLAIGMGVEPGMRVLRNTRYREETAGVMGSSLDLAHEIEIELSNRLGRRVAIEVRERLPVAYRMEKHAQVIPGDVDPAWSDHESRNGALRGGHAWHVSLEPGQTVLLRAAYTIRIPSKHEVIDGNRREG
jgi:hypothetical protein